MKTIFDYIAIIGAYCCNCIKCDGCIMTDIGIDMMLRGDYYG